MATYRTTQGYIGTGCRHHHRTAKGAIRCARVATNEGGATVRPYYAIRESDGAEIAEGPQGMPVVRDMLGLWHLIGGE